MKALSFGAVAVAATVVGCAAKPKEIQPTYVGTALYETLNCDRLVQESARVDSELAIAIKVQEDKVKANAAMIVFFGALGGMATQGKETEANVARLKGEQRAVHDTASKRGCVLPASAATVAGTPPTKPAANQPR
jgi:hypothetical protein